MKLSLQSNVLSQNADQRKFVAQKIALQKDQDLLLKIITADFA